MGSRELPSKMYSRRSGMVMRKHAAEDPFDKSTSEYYSCGRKGVQCWTSVSLRPFKPLQDNVDGRGAVRDAPSYPSTVSSAVSETNGSELSCVENDAHVQQVSGGCSSCKSEWEGSFEECGKYRKVDKLSPPNAEESREARVSSLDCTTESMVVPQSCVDEGELVSEKTYKLCVDCASLRGNQESVHEVTRACEVECDSQRNSDVDETLFEVGNAAALSLSSSRGGYRRTFPPPLSSVATQSYSDKLGQSPGTRAAAYCLRSFRCNGRFVLHEVKAPTHKYFRVLREDGRLKLELIDAVSESSSEEDEASVSDPWLEAGISDSVLGFVAESSYKQELRMEGIPTACEKTPERADAPALSMEVGKTPKNARPECLSSSEVHSSPASPRRIEMRARYSGSSADMKSSWGCPISAF